MRRQQLRLPGRVPSLREIALRDLRQPQRKLYAIYLLHYMFVSWLQYTLLPASLPGYAKFTIVFCGALSLSWLASAALRRIPAIARVV